MADINSNKKFIILLLVFLISISLVIFYYWDKKHTNNLDVSYYSDTIDLPPKFYYNFKKLLPHFIIYQAYADGEPLRFIRLGMDRSSYYFAPYYAFEKADALIGYGVFFDITFEDDFSNIYNKPSYGFDCGIPIGYVRPKNPKCIFENECIGTDDFILPGQKSSKKIHSFNTKLKQLNLVNKPIYLRFDTGVELVPGIFDEILENADYITGINLVIHYNHASDYEGLDELMTKIEKNFVLVSRFTHSCHSNKFKVTYTKGFLGQGMSLSYINKNLLDFYYIKPNQNSYNINFDGSPYHLIHSDILLYRFIPYVIKTSIREFAEQIKRKFVYGNRNRGNKTIR